MEDLKKISIQVSGVEDKDGKITLMEQTGGQKYPTRYSFFKTKQNTEEQTKAYEQFLELGVSTGQVYSLAVKETQGKNKGGKDVTYRNIMFFYTSETTEQPKTQQNADSGLSQRLDNAAKAFKTMDSKVKELETRIGVLEMEMAELKNK